MFTQKMYQTPSFVILIVILLPQRGTMFAMNRKSSKSKIKTIV